jgi:hypothetical protein
MVRARRLQSVYDSFCVETRTCLAALTTISYQGMTRIQLGIQLEIESSNLANAPKTWVFDQSPADMLLMKARQVI